MNELAKRRSQKNNDALLWTPLDALEDTIERIKSGELSPDRISIQMLSDPDKNGNRVHTYCAAGVNYETHIAMLSVALQRTINEWVC